MNNSIFRKYKPNKCIQSIRLNDITYFENLRMSRNCEKVSTMYAKYSKYSKRSKNCLNCVYLCSFEKWITNRYWTTMSHDFEILS